MANLVFVKLWYEFRNPRRQFELRIIIRVKKCRAGSRVSDIMAHSHTVRRRTSTFVALTYVDLGRHMSTYVDCAALYM